MKIKILYELCDQLKIYDFEELQDFFEKNLVHLSPQGDEEIDDNAAIQFIVEELLCRVHNNLTYEFVRELLNKIRDFK
jgi:hypothetical protein